MSLSSLFMNWGIQLTVDSCWLNHWKKLVPDPKRDSWNFCQTEGPLNDFHFEPLKVNKMTSSKIYISSHGEATSLPRNIKFRHQVNLIQRVLLGTPPQEVPMSLPHIHVTLTNLFIYSHRGYCYQILGRKNKYLIQDHKGTFILGVERHYLLITWFW